MDPSNRAISAPAGQLQQPPEDLVLNVNPVLDAISELIKLVNRVQSSIPCPPEAPCRVDASEATVPVCCFGSGSCPVDSNGEAGPPQTAQNGPVDNPTATGGSIRQRLSHEDRMVYNQADKLLRDLYFLKSELSKLQELGKDKTDLLQGLKYPTELQDALEEVKSASSFPTQKFHKQLESISQKVKDLKNHMPGRSSNIGVKHKKGKELHFDDYNNLSSDMREKIRDSVCFDEFFKGFECAFHDLSLQSKLCLLCFSIFPQRAVVRKKVLAYWWIGEGLVGYPLNKASKPLSAGPDVQLSSMTADQVLQELCSKGFIKPVLIKRKLSGFEMDPLVRFVVILLAHQLDFFKFDEMGVPTADFSTSHHAFLVKNNEGNKFSRWNLTRDESSESSNKGNEHSGDQTSNQKLDRLHTLFNVNDPYPDFKLEWFSKLKMLNVLCLGGWQGSRGHHIEVENTEFLKGLKGMKYLRYLSLQGISRIDDLPDSLCSLINLKILDLNACHHLDSLPKKLEQFKNLTHLDISECFLLDHIPKGLGQLKELLVLKGFVIGSKRADNKDTCTLMDLAGLKKLRKLSITSSREDFPNDIEVTVLSGFLYLKKLTIAWGGQSSNGVGNEAGSSTETGKVQPKGKSPETESIKGKPADKNIGFSVQKEEKDVSGEQKKKSDGDTIARKLEESKGKAIVQEPGEEAVADKKKEEKQVGSEQPVDMESGGLQKKANRGKGVNVTIKLPVETIERKDGKGDIAGPKKRDDGEKAGQGNVFRKVPEAMSSQQSVQPAAKPKLTSKPSMGRKLARALTLTTSPPVVDQEFKLEKLELQCCPLTKAPGWMLGKLQPSKKLYIRGGNLHSLHLQDSQGKPVKWQVKILCLKYLADIEMDWQETRELFPDLVYLEKSHCPKLTFFPCNSSGVWINNKPKVSAEGKSYLDEIKEDLSWSFLT